jgi:restriction endonuclease S subunit
MIELPVDVLKLPAKWEIKPLKDVAELKRGLSWSKADETDETGNLVISIPNIKEGWIDFESKFNHYLSIEIPESKRLKTGDILCVGSSGSIQNVGRNSMVRWLPSADIAFASFTFIISAKRSKIDNDFLYLLINSDIVPFHKFTKRAADGKYNFQLREFESYMRIPIPPLIEQQKIAHILGTVKKSLENQLKTIQTTYELKKSLIYSLFTNGTKGEKLKQTEIGMVPESWVVKPFESTGQVIYGIQAAVANNLKPIGYKILTNKNITIDGTLDLEKINYFQPTSQKHFNTILQKGDLLFNWRSGSKEHVGKTALFDLDNDAYVHSSFILRIRVNQNHNPRFLFYYLNYLREIGYYQKVQTFSINAKFNKSAINAMPIALPNKEIQDSIAEAIEVVDKKLLNLKAIYDLKLKLFRTLLHDLMTGQRPVKDIDFSIAEKGYELTNIALSIAAEA